MLCLAVSPSIGTAVGGLRLEGATRIGLGVGGRLGNSAAQLEGSVLEGVITGRRGFVGGGADDVRRVLPHVGGQASLVLFRWIVLSAAYHRTRLSLDVIPTGGGARTTRTSWSPVTTRAGRNAREHTTLPAEEQFRPVNTRHTLPPIRISDPEPAEFPFPRSAHPATA